MAQDNTAPEGIDLPEIEDFIETEELEALRVERDEFKDRFMRRTWNVVKVVVYPQ